MKVGISLAVVALAGCVVFSTVAQTPGTTEKRKTHVVARQAKDKYVCPMHANVTSDKSGECTKCGSAMEKRAAVSDAMHAKKHAVGGECAGKAMDECMKSCEGNATEGCAKECAGGEKAGCTGKH
jgi:hypothetical protein